MYLKYFYFKDNNPITKKSMSMNMINGTEINF